MAGTPKKRAKREAEAQAQAESEGVLTRIDEGELFRRQIVIAGVASGVPHRGIALALRITESQLRREYREELDVGKEGAMAMVTGSLFAIATDLTHKDCARAAQFWLQAQAGWRVREERQHSFGLGGGDVPPMPGNDVGISPVKITVEFVNHRPKGLPGGPDDPDAN